MKTSNLKICVEAIRKLNVAVGTLKKDPYGLGISLSQGNLLAFLQSSKTKPTAKEVATILNLEKSTVSRLLRDLERNGMISIKSNSDDRREMLIALTTKGTALAIRVNEVASAHVNAVFSQLSASEENELSTILYKCVSKIGRDNHA